MSDEASDRQRAQQARVDVLKDPAGAAIRQLQEQEEAAMPPEIPAYIVGMEALPEGVVLTIILPWPQVSAGGE